MKRPLKGLWRTSLVVFGLLLAAYLVNRRPAIGSSDTIAAEYLPLAILRGDGPVLDRFGAVWAPPGARVPSYMERSRGHLVSRYPIATPLFLVPLEAPQIWAYDRTWPGWDRQVASTFTVTQRMAKNASAFLAAVLGVCLYQYLRRIHLSWAALPATLAACLGSDLWVVASQAPWQHGPAALALVLSLLALATRVEPPNRRRLFLGGWTTALMVAFRPLDLVLAIVVLAWVVRRVPGRAFWFMPGPIVVGCLVLSWNFYWFGVAEGGQRAIEEVHGHPHGTFGGNPIAGGLGTLFSPGRGLFVYCPWVAAALAFLPWTWSSLRERSLVLWLTMGIVPYFMVLATYQVWWGGHTFGPRYWTDLTPLFAVLFGFALEEARRRGSVLVAILLLSTLLGVVPQVIGAFCFPSTWNAKPIDVNAEPGRLWQWRDCELRRCLLEGAR